MLNSLCDTGTGNGDGNGVTTAANGGTAGVGPQGNPDGCTLDAGLTKSAPSAEGLNQKNYRNYRRRLKLFAKPVCTSQQGHIHKGNLFCNQFPAGFSLGGN